VPCPQGDGGVQVALEIAFSMADDGVSCSCAPESAGSGSQKEPFVDASASV